MTADEAKDQAAEIGRTIEPLTMETVRAAADALWSAAMARLKASKLAAGVEAKRA